MKRQYRFRIWDGYKFITAEFLRMIELSPRGRHFIPLILNGFSESHNFIIQQFTGMKDKKGKRIYDGDIVKSKENPLGKIVYDETLGQYLISFDLRKNKINPNNCLMFCNDGGSNPTAKEVKIVGNIFEGIL